MSPAFASARCITAATDEVGNLQAAALFRERALAQERYYSTWGYGDTPTPAAAQPSGQPGWLLASLAGGLILADNVVSHDVSAYQSSREMAGFFLLVATAAPGKSLAEITAVIDQEREGLARDRDSAFLPIGLGGAPRGGRSGCWPAGDWRTHTSRSSR